MTMGTQVVTASRLVTAADAGVRTCDFPDRGFEQLVRRSRRIDHPRRSAIVGDQHGAALGIDALEVRFRDRAVHGRIVEHGQVQHDLAKVVDGVRAGADQAGRPLGQLDQRGLQRQTGPDGELADLLGSILAG